MSIYSNLQGELTYARRSKNKPLLELLQYIIGEVGREAKINTSDTNLVLVVNRVAKKLNEAHTLAPTEKSEYEVAEVARLIKDYLPHVMSTEELMVAIDKVIETGASNIGSVMGLLRKTGYGFDAQLAAVTIKQKLA